MNVLLINPPIRESEPAKIVPIGLAIIANVLLNEGHTVKVLDINAERLSKDQVTKRIDLDNKYDVIGTGGLITTYAYLKWLIPELKKYNPKSKIIIGGGAVTEKPTLLLSKVPADIAVIGEGEITISETISALENNTSLESVNGIAYKESDGQIKITPDRALVKDLDSLPFPAYDLFPMDIYIHNVGHSKNIGKKTEMGIITARGCPYNCNYCFHIFGKGVRVRSVDNVIGEIKLLKEKYNIESLVILDETFTLNKKRVAEFADKITKENINLPWSCYARVNVVDRTMLEKMKRAGCYRVGYGIESGSQKILDNMNKKVTVDQAKKAIRLTRDCRLICGTTFMFGYPGECSETAQETIDFCKELTITPGLFFTAPYPGTVLYEQAKEQIIKKYGDEESFIEVLGDVLDFTVNLTDMSDKELFQLKEETGKALKSKPWHLYPKIIYLKYKQFGLYLLIRLIFVEVVKTMKKLSKR